jgi:NADH dehydrogenase (ubiquinone) 1 alpha subcomplex subunit 8
VGLNALYILRDHPFSTTSTPKNAWCHSEDFMLCKAENRDPAHCLKEGRRVTRCATDLYALPVSFFDKPHEWVLLSPLLYVCFCSISKMRENCLQQFEAHWNCLEINNQVRVRNVYTRESYIS